MIKVYGSEMCPDCVNFKFNLDKNGMEYENIDINKELKNLKAFLKLRDGSDVFDDAKENGGIGIPAILFENGEISLDWEKYIEDQGKTVEYPGTTGQACRLDGKGC